MSLLAGLSKRIAAMLGRTAAQSDRDARVSLKPGEGRLATDLSKLTGKTTQQVREIAARRAEMAMRLQARRK